MKKDDIITLSNGRKVKVVKADGAVYKNIVIVETEDHQLRVVDKENMTLAKAKGIY